MEEEEMVEGEAEETKLRAGSSNALHLYVIKKPLALLYSIIQYNWIFIFLSSSQAQVIRNFQSSHVL